MLFQRFAMPCASPMPTKTQLGLCLVSPCSRCVEGNGIGTPRTAVTHDEQRSVDHRMP